MLQKGGVGFCPELGGVALDIGQAIANSTVVPCALKPDPFTTTPTPEVMAAFTMIGIPLNLTTSAPMPSPGPASALSAKAG